MIYDADVELLLAPPNDAGILSFSSNAIDLRGGGDGLQSALLHGEQLYMHCEVTTTFTAEAGSPLGQIGIAIGKADPLVEATSLILGMSGGQASSSLVGLPPGTAATSEVGPLGLQAGRSFYIPIPPIQDILEATGANFPNTVGVSELAAWQGFRYLGLCFQNVAGTPASNDFGAGQITGRICHRVNNNNPLSNIYPSRMEVS